MQATDIFQGVLIGGVVLGALGVVFAVMATKRSWLYRRVSSSQLTTIAAAPARGPVVIEAQVVGAEGGAFVAPLSRKQVVWARTVVRQRQGKEYRTIADDRIDRTIHVSDPSGHVALVVAATADVDGPPVFTATTGGFTRPTLAVQEWLSYRGLQLSDRFGNQFHRTFVESVVPVGDRVVVTGQVSRTPDGRVVLASQSGVDGRVTLTRGTRASLVSAERTKRILAVVGLVGGVGAALIGHFGNEWAEKEQQRETNAEHVRKIQEQLDVVEPRMDRLRSAKKDAAAHAPVSTTKITPQRGRTAELLFPAGMTDPFDYRRAPIEKCLEAASKTASQIDSRFELRNALPKCKDVRFVAILRKRVLAEAVVLEKEKKFSPARFVGDALVYDLDSGELVGTIAIDATNSESIQTSRSAAGKLHEDLVEHIERIIRENVSG